MKYWVYIHTCPNGKKYVGVTSRENPDWRWQGGKGYIYNKHFTSAILKYGWDNITHEVFEVGSKEEMFRKEIELISFYHSNDPKFGYNGSLGGESGSRGSHHVRSEEYRRKQSEVQKGKHRRGVPYTPEHRESMSRAQKGIPKPKHIYEYLLPDGTTRLLSPQAVGRIYTKKGIKVVRV